MNLLDKFNNTFVDFIDDLCTAYPTDGDLRMYKLMLSTALMADDMNVQTYFHKHVVLNYQNQIAAENDAFFIEKDYSAVANKMSGAQQLIDKLKHYWRDMTDDNRKIVWRYMKVLVILSTRIHNSK